MRRKKAKNHKWKLNGIWWGSFCITVNRIRYRICVYMCVSVYDACANPILCIIHSAFMFDETNWRHCLRYVRCQISLWNLCKRVRSIAYGLCYIENKNKNKNTKNDLRVWLRHGNRCISNTWSKWKKMNLKLLGMTFFMIL